MCSALVVLVCTLGVVIIHFYQNYTVSAVITAEVLLCWVPLASITPQGHLLSSCCSILYKIPGSFFFGSCYTWMWASYAMWNHVLCRWRDPTWVAAQLNPLHFAQNGPWLWWKYHYLLRLWHNLLWLSATSTSKPLSHLLEKSCLFADLVPFVHRTLVSPVACVGWFDFDFSSSSYSQLTIYKQQCCGASFPRTGFVSRACRSRFKTHLYYFQKLRERAALQ